MYNNNSAIPVSSGQLCSNGSESESNIVDSLLYDIRTGFPIKKDSEKDLKVKNAKLCSVDINGSFVY
jgi:hypothetical protein